MSKRKQPKTIEAEAVESCSSPSSDAMSFRPPTTKVEWQILVGSPEALCIVVSDEEEVRRCLVKVAIDSAATWSPGRTMSFSFSVRRVERVTGWSHE